VADDLSVKGSNGTSCGAGTLTGMQLCAPALETAAENISGWSFDAVNGDIDAETGLFNVHVTGNRIGDLNVHYMNGRWSNPHTVPLFPRPFVMAPDDGATRSFGSLAPSAVRSGTSTFTLTKR
jgi:hypothetical protein